VGASAFAFGAKAVLVHHQFLIGGLYGTCLLISYKVDFMSPGLLYLVANIPLMIIAYVQFSRRFFLYSLWGVIVLTIASELINFNLGIEEQLYAAVAGGVICGVGTGMILRSLGSGGGLDIVALMLNRRYNIGVGKFFISYNIILFSFAIVLYDIDLVIASIILTAISSGTLEYVLAIFNNRKVVYILSNSSKVIAETIWSELKQGATVIPTKGAYLGKERPMLMTITNNLQLKRLEDKVFAIDPDALFIVENSFNVIGSSFGKRKLY
jgi:uncharacterized membrane-anchored protein YitT (DUF2179 family)